MSEYTLIRELKAENARLREALQRIIERDNDVHQTSARIAHEALSPTGGEDEPQPWHEHFDTLKDNGPALATDKPEGESHG